MSLLTAFMVIICLILLILFICLLRDSLTFDLNTYVIKAIDNKIEDPELDDGKYENVKLNELMSCDFKNSKSEFEFLLLSDIHFETSIINKRKIYTILNQHKDLPLFIAGDLISKKRGKKKGLAFLKELADINPQRKILFVRGNHDSSISYQDILSTGVIPLFNEAIILQNDAGESYQISGIDDYRIAHSSIKDSIKNLSQFNEFELNEVPFERRILLAHNPDSILNEETKYFSFVFSGHFHDGQIRLPFRMEFKTLRDDKLAQDYKIYKGFFLNSSTLSYISSGLGTVLIPIRFFTRGEICHFKIVK